MMKKRMISVISALLCLFLLCACNGNGGKPELKNRSFVFRGIEITIGEKAPDVLAALAEYRTAVSAGASCLQSVPGEDVTYVYPGFRLQTFRLAENDPDEVIRFVILSDDSVATPEGIAIGASRDAVIAAYGAGDDSQANRLVYRGSSSQLVFRFRSDVVVGISYEVTED